MGRKYIDTNILVRYYENEEPEHLFFEKLLEQNDTYFVPSIVIAELFWVLDKVYNMKKDEIVDRIQELQNTRNIQIEQKHNLKLALEYFRKYKIKFTDCLILSYLNKEDTLITHDREFEKVKGVKVATL